jgi:hypothetical protein
MFGALPFLAPVKPFFSGSFIAASPIVLWATALTQNTKLTNAARGQKY